jgi:hypothetical protein
VIEDQGRAELADGGRAESLSRAIFRMVSSFR